MVSGDQAEPPLTGSVRSPYGTRGAKDGSEAERNTFQSGSNDTAEPTTTPASAFDTNASGCNLGDAPSHASGTTRVGDAAAAAPELKLLPPPRPHAFLMTSPYFPMFMYQRPDRIDDKLYLGSLNSASNREELMDLGVKAIITVANDTGSPPFPHAFTYTLVSVADSSTVNLVTHFDRCFQAVEEGVKQGGVLVHCMAGMSRSATIVIAYLMKTKGWDLKKALTHVRRCRPIVQPNIGFMRQLQEYEATLKHGARQKGIWARWFS